MVSAAFPPEECSGKKVLLFGLKGQIPSVMADGGTSEKHCFDGDLAVVSASKIFTQPNLESGSQRRLKKNSLERFDSCWKSGR